MFKWLKRKNKDEEIRAKFNEVLDKKSEAIDRIRERLDQFKLPEDRRHDGTHYDGPERRAHA